MIDAVTQDLYWHDKVLEHLTDLESTREALKAWGERNLATWRALNLGTNKAAPGG